MPASPVSWTASPDSSRRLGWVLLALSIALGGTIRFVAHHAGRSAALDRPLRRDFREPEELAAPTPAPLISESGTTNSPAKPSAVPAAEPVVPEATIPKPAKLRAAPGQDLFNDLLIPRLVVEVDNAGYDQLERDPRHYVRARVREGARVFTNVALRLKGSAGSFRGVDDRPSFTLNFDKYADGQTFHGLKKIHLNSSIQDRSFLAEQVSRELFNAAGVPAPRAGHALVRFDGRDLGLYVLLEGVNRQFLKQHFADPSGNVYDGHSGADVNRRMPTNEGETPRDQTRLRQLAEAAAEPDAERRQAALESVLDVDRFLTFVALETILGHWDGYTMNRNNFRIFHDRSTDRLVFLPHGLDQILTRQDATIVPRASGLVARSVLEVPALRARYRARFEALISQRFRPGVLRERIREISAGLDAATKDRDEAETTARQRRVDNLARRIEQRGQALDRLLHPAEQLSPGEREAAPSFAWQSKLDLGRAEMLREQAPDGRWLVKISTQEGCTASWRNRAALEPGRYRFDARIKTTGVSLDPDDPRAGAGLRISRQRQGQRHAGDRDWMPVHCDFEVEGRRSEVELVCELRAQAGTIWFDEASLKLRRQ